MSAIHLLRGTIYFLSIFLICLTHSLTLLLIYPLNFIHHRLYITIEKYFSSQCMSAFIVPFVSLFPEIRIYSDSLDIAESLSDDKCIVLANHQESGDVPLMICLLTHLKQAYNCSWILDRMFRWTPIGIPCRWHNDFFSVEGSREKIIAAIRKYFTTTYFDRGFKWMVMFPEGGYLKNRGQ